MLNVIKSEESFSRLDASMVSLILNFKSGYLSGRASKKKCKI